MYIAYTPSYVYFSYRHTRYHNIYANQLSTRLKQNYTTTARAFRALRLISKRKKKIVRNNSSKWNGARSYETQL